MRTFRKSQQWLEVFQAQQESGLSIAEFCRRHDIPSSFFILSVIS